MYQNHDPMNPLDAVAGMDDFLKSCPRIIVSNEDRMEELKKLTQCTISKINKKQKSLQKTCWLENPSLKFKGL